MIILTVSVILLLPQAVAAQRVASPAGRLTLLMLGLCGASVILAAQAMGVPPLATADDPQTYFTVSLSPLTYAVLGLALLTPAYWMIEEACPHRDSRVDGVLIQTLALILTAALAGGANSMPLILTEWAAVALTCVLALRGYQAFTQPGVKK